MWDLVYPATCVHCDTLLPRKNPFTSPFVPFFCPSCQLLVCDQGRIKSENSKVLFYQGFLVHSVFSFNSPLYSLYAHKRFKSEVVMQLLSSMLVLLFEETLFKKGARTYFLMPSKKEHLRTHRSPFFTLYQSMKHHFIHDAIAIYSRVSSEIRQGSDWYYKEAKPESSSSASLFILLEQYKQEDRERVSQFCAWLKKEYGLGGNYHLCALFA